MNQYGRYGAYGAYGAGPVTAVINLVGAAVKATGDIVSGSQLVKSAKLTAEANIKTARTNLMTGIVQYKGTQLQAEMAPLIAKEESRVALANAQRTQQTLILLGGGAMAVAVLGLLAWSQKGGK